MRKETKLGAVAVDSNFFWGGTEFRKLSDRNRIVRAIRTDVDRDGGSETTFGRNDTVHIDVPEPVPPTAEEVAAARLATAKRWLESEGSIAQGVVNKFREGFAQDPSYAFEWADEAMRAAAMLQFTARTEAWLSTGISLDIALTEITRQLLSEARSPKQSSSACSNLMAQYTVAAMAAFVSRMEVR